MVVMGASSSSSSSKQNKGTRIAIIVEVAQPATSLAISVGVNDQSSMVPRFVDQQPTRFRHRLGCMQFGNPFRNSDHDRVSAQRRYWNTSVNHMVQRGIRSIAVLVMFILLLPSLIMVTRHLQSQERWGSGTFTEQRRLAQRHTPRLLHFHLHVHAYRLSLDVMII
jgi:hypothetical protein